MSAVPELTAERLLTDARERAHGLSDFGAGYEENLAALLELYQGNARLTPAGVRSTRRRLLSLLTNRLRIAEALRAHPEILTRVMRSPLYVVGLPRTGTSALFNMLACDPRSRPLLYWEGLHPDPAPACSANEPDPRLVQTQSDLERAYASNPQFRAVHHVSADGPEECVALLAHTLGSVQQGIEPLISPYREYFRAQDQRDNYRYYLSLLRLLDAQRPGERWLLKSPAHLWALGPLLECAPDACIVWTHRDPVRVVASYSSMLEALSVVREVVDPCELGRAVLDYLAASVERALHERAQLPAARFYDVGHEDALRDPWQVVERIYAHFGFASEQALVAMRSHRAVEPAAGQHRYDLARYGLRPAEIQERFGAYTRRFAEFLPPR
jgi:hypothetical protein